MAVSQIKAVFNRDVKKIWEIVTSLENYAWRSDLGKIEILNDRQFVEYTKSGYTTNFTITVKDPCKRYELDMENSNIKGHWTGLFTQKGNQTEVEFTESVTAKKIFMKPLIKSYLKRQQSLYISDLHKFLDNEIVSAITQDNMSKSTSVTDKKPLELYSEDLTENDKKTLENFKKYINNYKWCYAVKEYHGDFAIYILDKTKYEGKEGWHVEIYGIAANQNYIVVKARADAWEVDANNLEVLEGSCDSITMAKISDILNAKINSRKFTTKPNLILSQDKYKKIYSFSKIKNIDEYENLKKSCETYVSKWTYREVLKEENEDIFIIRLSYALCYNKFLFVIGSFKLIVSFFETEIFDPDKMYKKSNIRNAEVIIPDGFDINDRDLTALILNGISCYNECETVLADELKYKNPRKTKEEFDEIRGAFTNWALHESRGIPFSSENRAYAVEKFNLTEDEFYSLLRLTDQDWIW